MKRLLQNRCFQYIAKLIALVCILFSPFTSIAQKTILTVKGVELTLFENDLIYVNGSVYVDSINKKDGEIINNGKIIITDSIYTKPVNLFSKTSNPFLANDPNKRGEPFGEVQFNGGTVQTVNGVKPRSIQFNEIFINNPAGVKLKNSMITLGQLNFPRGGLNLNGKDMYLYYDLSSFYKYDGKLGVESNDYRVWDNTRIKDLVVKERSGHVLGKFTNIPDFISANIGLSTTATSISDTILVQRGHINLPYAADGSIRKYFFVKEIDKNSSITNLNSDFVITYLDSADFSGLALKESDFRMFMKDEASPITWAQVSDSNEVKVDENKVTGNIPLINSITSVVTVADFNCKNPPRVFLKPTMNVCLGTRFEIEFERVEKPDDEAEITYKWEWTRDGVSRAMMRNESQIFSDTLNTSDDVTYKVTATDTRGCFSSSTITVTALPIPVSTLQVKQPLCKDSPIKLSATSNLTGITYSWSFADGTPVFTTSDMAVEHTYSTAKDYNVTLISSKDNCTSTANRNITINPLPDVDLSLNDLCGKWEFLNTSRFNPDLDNAIDTSKWTFGVGDILTIGDPALQRAPFEHQFSSMGQKSITLEVKSNKRCISSITKTVTIDKQTADFSADKYEVCIGEKVVFKNLSTPKSAGAPVYTWDFGDFSPAVEIENTEKTYDKQGTYEVVLSMKTGDCEDTIKKSIIVKPNPDVKGINITPSTICQGENAKFEPQATSSSYDYKWDILGETILEASPTRTFTGNGITYVTLTVTSLGCSSQYNSSVNVKPKPKANFTYTSDCSGKPIQFYNTSTVSGATLSYSWNILGNETAVNPVCTFNTNSGSVDVTLIASSNGCSDAITKSVEIYKIPIIELGDISDCVTSRLIDATVSNIPVCTYIWDDGIMSPIRTVNQSKYYTVKVTSDKSCEAEKTIMVDLGVERKINLPDNISFCESGKLNSGFDKSITTWWKPDGTTLSNENEIVADQQGLYKVVVADQYCSASKQVSVTINPLPMVSLGDDINECEGAVVTLDAGGGFASYLWSTGQITRTINVNRADLYKVTVKDGNGCENVGEVRVNIHALPEKPFTTDEISECKAAQLYAGSTTLLYLWKTGETSNAITVNSSGDYWVKVSNSSCSVYDTVKVNILGVDEVNLGEDIAVCEGNQVVLNAGNHDSSYSYLWNKQASVSNLFTVTKPGWYVCDIKNNGNGCISSDDIFVRFNPSPRVDLGTDRSLCGSSFLTLDAGNQGSTIQWGSDNGFVSIQQIVNITEPDRYWVMVMNSYGCLAYDTIQIYPTSSNIVASFIAASKIFAGDTVVFKNMSYPESYTSFWSFGDGSTSIEEHPRHIYYYPSIFNAVLTVTNGYCTSTTSKPITVLEDNRKIGKDGKRIGERYLEIVSSKLYPNPTQGTITFEIELSDYADVVVGIYSIRGVLISMEKIKQSLSISKQYYLNNLSPGIYILKVWVGSKSAAYKIVKTR